MRKWYYIILWLVLIAGGVLSAQAQSITSISPNSAEPGQTFTVSIYGQSTHFKQGYTSVAFSSAGITILKPLAVSSNVLAQVVISVSRTASPGPVNVRVSTVLRGSVENVSGTFDVFSPAGGTFMANIEIMPTSTINLKNIDLTNPSAQPVLFITNLYNNSIRQIVKVTLSLYNKGTISQQTLLGSAAYTTPRLGIDTQYSFNNRSFNSYTFTQPTGQNFENTVEATGSFPPDNYIYQIVVTDSAGNVLATATAGFILTGPNANPELITPGMSLNSGSIPEVYTQYPIFQWFGENSNYTFALYFYRPGQTAEEVVRTLPVYRDSGIVQNNFVYPLFAEKLIDGRTYAWQIMGTEMTANGIQYIPSDVYLFTYMEPSDGRPIPTSIDIAPQDVTLSNGQEYKFTALVYDQNGNLLQDAMPIWQVTPPGMGTISATGLFTAAVGTSGAAAIIASAGNAVQFSPITVGNWNLQLPSNNTKNTNMNTNTPRNKWDIDKVMRTMFGVQAQ